MTPAHQAIDQTSLSQAHVYLTAARVDVDGLACALDKLSPSARLAWVRSLGRAEQMRLFEVACARAMRVEDLVPADHPPGTQVICEGLNTLPAFRRFQKRFCRLGAGDAELCGYNHQAMSVFTGPGYFVAYDDGERGEVIIDYRRLPGRTLPIWPAIVPNSQRLGRLVYEGMVDRVRKVSTHVFVGRAFRGEGRPMDAWFVLCRQI